MSSYAELKEQMDKLRQEAERARQQELPKVIAAIKNQIEEYEIKPQDLFDMRPVQIAKSPTGGGGRGKGREPKYRGPNGQTWVGGPGRKPDWVRDALARGEDLEKYAI